ncbi:MAG: hypothetical protein AB7P69_03915 [Candidatus Binatia bacterium]
MATTHTTLTALAQQAAEQIGFTARRWWRDAVDPAVLRVEVERRLVGAPPAIAELTVAIPLPQGQRQKRAATASSPRRKRSTTRSKSTNARGRQRVQARKAEDSIPASGPSR